MYINLLLDSLLCGPEPQKHSAVLLFFTCKWFTGMSVHGNTPNWKHSSETQSWILLLLFITSLTCLTCKIMKFLVVFRKNYGLSSWYYPHLKSHCGLLLNSVGVKDRLAGQEPALCLFSKIGGNAEHWWILCPNIEYHRDMSGHVSTQQLYTCATQSCLLLIWGLNEGFIKLHRAVGAGAGFRFIHAHARTHLRLIVVCRL